MFDLNLHFPFLSEFGNSKGGGFPLRLECSADVVALELKLSDQDHLHISEILLCSGAVRIDIREVGIASYATSSVDSENWRIFSVENWCNRKNEFFSTKYNRNAYARFVLSDAISSDSILIENRLDGLWDRTAGLRVGIFSLDQGYELIWDAVDPSCLNRRLGKMFSAARDALKPFCQHDPLLRQLEAGLATYMSSSGDFSDDEMGGLVQRMLAVLVQYLEKLSVEDSGWLRLDIVPLVEVLSCSSLRSNPAVMSSGIVGMLASHMDIEAFGLFRRTVRKFADFDVASLIAKTQTLGRLDRGYPLIPTAHSFQRPLNSYSEIDLRVFMRAVMTCLDRSGLGRSLMCYGTLLGAIRENDFIPHDDDIDILFVLDPLCKQDEWSIVDRLTSAFAAEGFDVRLNPINDEGGYPIMQIARSDFPLFIDVFLADNHSETVRMPMHNVRLGDVPVEILLPVRTLSEGKFAGFAVPRNAEKFLHLRYGADWRTPDPNFRIKEK